MNIYIVERGDYSDRVVVGVFSTQARAAAYVRRHDVPWKNYQTTEWMVDRESLAAIELRRPYSIHRGACGELIATESGSEDHRPYVMARDKEHAIKIAAEQLAQDRAFAEDIG